MLLHPALRGDWPVGHDHPVHVGRIAQLKQTILKQGVPGAWSHRWFAGYPQNVVHPIGADLFVLAVQLLSFGALSVTKAYASRSGCSTRSMASPCSRSCAARLARVRSLCSPPFSC